MKLGLQLVFLVVAIILFVLRALGIGAGPKVDIGWLGLAFFAAAFVF